jgi:hypothetical protein
MTTVFFEESTEKKATKALLEFLSTSSTKPIEVKKERTLDDLTREDYLASIPYNRRPIAISKSFRENYGKI